MTGKIFSKLTAKSFELIDLPNSPQRHFSYILKKGRIISIGVNNGWQTHPLAKKFGHRFSAIHSELAALKAMPYPISYLDKCTLVNIRINKSNELCMSKPCIHCQAMLAMFGIKKIFYTDYYGNFVQF